MAHGPNMAALISTCPQMFPDNLNGQSTAPAEALNDYLAQVRNQENQPYFGATAPPASTIYPQVPTYPTYYAPTYSSVMNQAHSIPSNDVMQRLLKLESDMKRMETFNINMENGRDYQGENVNAIFDELEQIRTGQYDVPHEAEYQDKGFRNLTTEESSVIKKLIGTIKLSKDREYATTNKAKPLRPSEIMIGLRSDGYYSEVHRYSCKEHSGETGWRPDGVWRDGQRASIVDGGLEIEVQRRDWTSEDVKNLPIRRFEFVSEKGRNLVILKKDNIIVATYEMSDKEKMLQTKTYRSKMTLTISPNMTALIASYPQLFPANLHQLWPRPAGASVITEMIESNSSEFTVSQSDGSLPVFVAYVQPNSKTEQEGLRAGDRILSSNGCKINNTNDYFFATKAYGGIQLRVERIVDNGQNSSAVPLPSCNDHVQNQMMSPVPIIGASAPPASTVYPQVPDHPSYYTPVYNSAMNQAHTMPSNGYYSNDQRILMLEKNMSDIRLDMEMNRANNEEDLNAIFEDLEGIHMGQNGEHHGADQDGISEYGFRNLTIEECSVMDKLIGTMTLVKERQYENKHFNASEITIALRSDGFYSETLQYACKGHRFVNGWRPDGVWRDGQRATIVNGGLNIELQTRDWTSKDLKNVPIRRFEFVKENGRDLVILKNDNQIVASYEKSENLEELLRRGDFMIGYLLIMLFVLSAFCFYFGGQYYKMF